jgi:molybdate/tungstate transport system ATP-binding protein
MLEVQGLTLRGGVFRVREVSFRISPGTTHVLLGPTGNGKTLLMEGIAGLRTPEEGRVFVAGKDLTNQPPERRGMGYVPQDLALFPHLRVLDNILFAPRIQGRLDKTAHRLARELMAQLGISALADRWPRLLSGGERQRVALARALVSGSRLLLLDEPFASLNEGLRRELWMTLKSLQADLGLTLLLITHDLEEAFFLGDQISVLIDGTLQQTDRAEDLYRRPRTKAVAQYLGITNLFHGTLDPDRSEIACPNLGVSLAANLPDSFAGIGTKRGASITVGIRSDEVKVIRPGFDEVGSMNRMQGRIAAIYNRGSIHTLVVRPHLSNGTTIDVEVSSRSLAKLGLVMNAEITIALKPAQLLLFHEKPEELG